MTFVQRCASFCVQSVPSAVVECLRLITDSFRFFGALLEEHVEAARRRYGMILFWEESVSIRESSHFRQDMDDFFHKGDVFLMPLFVTGAPARVPFPLLG